MTNRVDDPGMACLPLLRTATKVIATATGAGAMIASSLGDASDNSLLFESFLAMTIVSTALADLL